MDKKFTLISAEDLLKLPDCPTCEGTGIVEDPDNDRTFTCRNCAGTGVQQG